MALLREAILGSQTQAFLVKHQASHNNGAMVSDNFTNSSLKYFDTSGRVRKIKSALVLAPSWPSFLVNTKKTMIYNKESGFGAYFLGNRLSPAAITLDDKTHRALCRKLQRGVNQQPPRRSTRNGGHPPSTRKTQVELNKERRERKEERRRREMREADLELNEEEKAQEGRLFLKKARKNLDGVLREKELTAVSDGRRDKWRAKRVELVMEDD